MADIIKFPDKTEPEEYMWQCECGSVNFHVAPTYIYCAECKLEQEFGDYR